MCVCVKENIVIDESILEENVMGCRVRGFDAIIGRAPSTVITHMSLGLDWGSWDRYGIDTG